MNRAYILTVTICGLLMLTGAGLLAWGTSAAGIRVVGAWQTAAAVRGE